MRRGLRRRLFGEIFLELLDFIGAGKHREALMAGRREFWGYVFHKSPGGYCRLRPGERGGFGADALNHTRQAVAAAHAQVLVQAQALEE